MWTRALVVFYILGVVGSLLALLIHTYFLRNLDYFTSYEIGTTTFLFPFANEDGTLNIDFDKQKASNWLKCLLIFDILVMCESTLTLYKFFKPYRAMEAIVDQYN